RTSCRQTRASSRCQSAHTHIIDGSTTQSWFRFCRILFKQTEKLPRLQATAPLTYRASSVRLNSSRSTIPLFARWPPVPDLNGLTAYERAADAPRFLCFQAQWWVLGRFGEICCVVRTT